MSENQQGSLFTEVADRESATVSGGSITSGSGFSGANSSSDDLNMLFFLPQPSQLYLYDPRRALPYKTLVV
ncbi:MULTISPECIES: secretion protein HlyD [unclassified Microcoleus]|uniref:secretion protein HlyD n=1 Tax=unclassified Microcoleus TaxID=2642155 RepID=UPI002FD7184D